MKRLIQASACALLCAGGVVQAAADRSFARDVVIYGSSPAALTAAVEGGCAVQDVPYETLAATLCREGHVIGK